MLLLSTNLGGRNLSSDSLLYSVQANDALVVLVNVEMMRWNVAPRGTSVPAILVVRILRMAGRIEKPRPRQLCRLVKYPGA
jgi:hypothetical protein